MCLFVRIGMTSQLRHLLFGRGLMLVLSPHISSLWIGFSRTRFHLYLAYFHLIADNVSVLCQPLDSLLAYSPRWNHLFLSHPFKHPSPLFARSSARYFGPYRQAENAELSSTSISLLTSLATRLTSWSKFKLLLGTVRMVFVSNLPPVPCDLNDCPVAEACAPPGLELDCHPENLPLCLVSGRAQPSVSRSMMNPGAKF
jgi:hypothetical protein